jgi:hypothetical protein
VTLIITLYANEFFHELLVFFKDVLPI